MVELFWFLSAAAGIFRLARRGHGGMRDRDERTVECWNGAPPRPLVRSIVYRSERTERVRSGPMRRWCAGETKGQSRRLMASSRQLASVRRARAGSEPTRRWRAGACGSSRGRDSTPPAGSFKRMDVNFEKACAIGIDGHMECWSRETAPAIDGTFVELSEAAPSGPTAPSPAAPRKVARQPDRRDVHEDLGQLRHPDGLHLGLLGWQGSPTDCIAGAYRAMAPQSSSAPVLEAAQGAGTDCILRRALTTSALGRPVWRMDALVDSEPATTAQ